MEAKKNMYNSKWLYVAIALVAGLMVFNQLQINSISGYFATSSGRSSISLNLFSGSSDLKNVDVTTIQSTAQAVKMLFPLDEVKTADDVMAIMFPTGIPEYGQEMGVSFDDPVNSLNLMANAYPALKNEAKANPDIWKRYIALAAEPRGISCEFCCGVGPQGISKEGEALCGCSHAPAVQTVTLWLMLNRPNYSDAEILREVMRWKTIFFPKNMIELGLEVSGKSADDLELPGMVGGC